MRFFARQESAERNGTKLSGFLHNFHPVIPACPVEFLPREILKGHFTGARRGRDYSNGAPLREILKFLIRQHQPWLNRLRIQLGEQDQPTRGLPAFGGASQRLVKGDQGWQAGTTRCYVVVFQKKNNPFIFVNTAPL